MGLCDIHYDSKARVGPLLNKRWACLDTRHDTANDNDSYTDSIADRLLRAPTDHYCTCSGGACDAKGSGSGRYGGRCR